MECGVQRTRVCIAAGGDNNTDDDDDDKDTHRRRQAQGFVYAVMMG